MPRIADYTIIRDGSFELRTGGDIDQSFAFTVSDTAHLGSRSILAFILDTESNANNLLFRVEINGTHVRTARINGDTFQTIHEVVSANVLQHGSGSNNIDFSIIGGSGDVHFSDVVLWWQRDI